MACQENCLCLGKLVHCQSASHIATNQPTTNASPHIEDITKDINLWFIIPAMVLGAIIVIAICLGCYCKRKVRTSSKTSDYAVLLMLFIEILYALVHIVHGIGTIGQICYEIRTTSCNMVWVAILKVGGSRITVLNYKVDDIKGPILDSDGSNANSA